MSTLTVSLLLVICCCHRALSWPNIPPLVNTAQVENVSRERIKALMDRDDSAFTKYYMPDFQLITAWGTVEDTTFLERWIKSAPPGSTLVPSNYRVTVSTDDSMAFATFQIAETYPDSSGGSPTNITSRYTEVYIHRHRQWMLQEAHFSYLTTQSDM
jgi:ketosteroid isomerase-like protein